MVSDSDGDDFEDATEFGVDDGEMFGMAAPALRKSPMSKQSSSLLNCPLSHKKENNVLQIILIPLEFFSGKPDLRILCFCVLSRSVIIYTCMRGGQLSKMGRKSL